MMINALNARLTAEKIRQDVATKQCEECEKAISEAVETGHFEVTVRLETAVIDETEKMLKYAGYTVERDEESVMVIKISW